MQENYNNIYWFLIDGLSPDYLSSCGNGSAVPNFFDELLSAGSVFSDVATTDAGTHTSMHSIFSSLMPSCNGASGWIKAALRSFNQDIYTITDVLKLNGYRTYRYCDADGERTVPMSGFDVWESSNYKISELLSLTDMCNTERRKQFVKEVNEYKGNKFIYHHNLLLHELNGKMGEFWSSKGYLENIGVAAYYFEKIYREYNITTDDLVIISSDHGVILDRNWQKDGIENGERHYEQSVKAFWAMIGKGLPKKKLSKRISSLDIAPTVFKIIFDLDYMRQGHSREQYLYNDEYSSLPCYREKGSWAVEEENRNPLNSDVYYVWKDNWKYVYGKKDTRCEWLINLESDKDYAINLKTKFPDKVAYLRELIKVNVIDPVIENYLSSDRKNMFPDKREIKKFFSIVIDKPLKLEAWDDIFDIAGPYYEIVYSGEEETVPLKYRNNYKLKIAMNCQTCNEIIQYCSAEWIVFLKEAIGYSEYFLSDLYRCICLHGNVSKIKAKWFTAIKKSCNNESIIKCSHFQIRCIADTRSFLTKKNSRRIVKGFREMIVKVIGNDND